MRFLSVTEKSITAMAHPEISSKEIRRSSRRSKRSSSSKKGDGVESSSSRRRSRKQHVEEKQRRKSRRRREDSPKRRHKHDELVSPEALAHKEIQRQQKRAMVKRVARRGSAESDDLFTMFRFSSQIETDETHLELEREKFAKMQRRESMKKRQPISAESLFPETEKEAESEKQEHVHQKGRVKRRESFLHRLSVSMRISPAADETPTSAKPVKRGSFFGKLLRRASSLASSSSEDY